jgi:sulfite exporter TauE/SafE
MPELSLLAAFLTGLLGGAHCVGMCGGIVAAISFQPTSFQSTSLQPISFQSQTKQPFSFHLAYSVGRIASYASAGALAGLVGAATFLADTLFPLQMGLYILA